MCMHHGSHQTRLSHLEDDMKRVVTLLDEYGKQITQNKLDTAKLGAKLAGMAALAQIMVQLGFKFFGQ